MEWEDVSYTVARAAERDLEYLADEAYGLVDKLPDRPMRKMEAGMYEDAIDTIFDLALDEYAPLQGTDPRELEQHDLEASTHDALEAAIRAFNYVESAHDYLHGAVDEIEVEWVPQDAPAPAPQ